MRAPAHVYARRRAGLVLAVVALVFLVVQLVPSEARRIARGTNAGRPFAGEVLVYGRHGLTDAEVATLQAAAAVPVAPVYGGEVAFASGQAGFPEVPVDTLTVEPRGYAAAANTPRLARELAAGVVLSRLGAHLRQAQVGGTLLLADGRRLNVSAIEDDALLGGYEAATAITVLGHRAAATASYLLVAAGSRGDSMARRLRAALPGRDLRIESHTANGILSSADTVLTQAQIKTRFGEFAVRVDSSGTLRLSQRWIQSWIVSTSIPQLGVITCNRAIIGPLRAAMEEITSKGLGSLVHTADFQREGGCWNPRVERFSSGQLSAHAWGIAVDINVDVNPLGASPRQDARLVAIMAKHGFTWGGRFLRPDGAHFEWTGAGS